MAGLEFSLPYNGELATLDALLAMNGRGGNRVREVYLGVPQDVAGSGRAGSRGHMTTEEFLQLADRIHAAGVHVDMTMNATCGGSAWYADEHVTRLVTFIRSMHEEHGVEAVTLANPFHIERVRATCPDLEISASVLAEVDCVARAQAFASAGATTVTPATSINRDLKQLAALRRVSGLEVKLMVNEGCLYKCPFRLFHMNLISHRSKEGEAEGQDFSFACGDRVAADPAELFRANWVRPEELALYEQAGVTTFFKVVGRDMLASKVLRACGAYLDEGYDGNLLDLMCSSVGFYSVDKGAYVDNKALGASSYFKRLSTCNRKCYDCTYCDELVRRFVRYGWVTEENLRDMGQGMLADSIRARFGGRYPACPTMSATPGAYGAQAGRAQSGGARASGPHASGSQASGAHASGARPSPLGRTAARKAAS